MHAYIERMARNALGGIVGNAASVAGLIHMAECLRTGSARKIRESGKSAATEAFRVILRELEDLTTDEIDQFVSMVKASDTMQAILTTERSVYVTNAPVAYDGFGTFTLLEFLAHRDGRDFRAVAIESGNSHWQTERYASGCNVTLTFCQYEEWVRLGLFEEVVSV